MPSHSLQERGKFFVFSFHVRLKYTLRRDSVPKMQVNTQPHSSPLTPTTCLSMVVCAEVVSWTSPPRAPSQLITVHPLNKSKSCFASLECLSLTTAAPSTPPFSSLSLDLPHMLTKMIQWQFFGLHFPTFYRHSILLDPRIGREENEDRNKHNMFYSLIEHTAQCHCLPITTTNVNVPITCTAILVFSTIHSVCPNVSFNRVKPFLFCPYCLYFSS